MKTTLVAVALALVPAGVRAHALDEYVQAARLSLSRSHVGLEMSLTPGVEVAASIAALIDRDRDGVVTPDEAAAYATRVLRESVVELNGHTVLMTLARVEVPPLGEMRDGVGTIRVSASGIHGTRLGGEARLTFRNDHAPEKSVYLVNALVPDDHTIAVAAQQRDWSQRSARIAYNVTPALDVQIGWLLLAVGGTVGLVLVRKSLEQRRERPEAGFDPRALRGLRDVPRHYNKRSATTQQEMDAEPRRR
jgi:hypothetical protein